MGRHSTPMTRDQALEILAYDIADLISNADGYDGLIPEDALTQDDLIKLLPGLFRAAGFDPFAAKPEDAAASAEQEPEFVRHTCNPNRPGMPLPFGRKAPRGECRRCDQLRDGAAPREAHPAIQASRRRESDHHRWLREWNDHKAGKHHNGRCDDGPVCTFGQW